MTSRTSSYSSQVPRQPSRRPTLNATLSSSLSSADQVEDADVQGAAVESQIEQEIAEIKRYEVRLIQPATPVPQCPEFGQLTFLPQDFTTIDWVQDAAQERLRRKARRKRRQSSVYDNSYVGWRSWAAESYEAAQGWIVVTIIGIAIGLNAAFLNIVSEWLSDIKLGHCKTAFYLNENFCCWGEDNGCNDWQPWTNFGPINYIIYIIFATIFACTAATLVKSYAPYAAGSGISEIKCIIAGFVMKGFLGSWTLLIKSVGLPLTIGSGLSVGKEGPSVHYAVCTGNVISRLFAKYRSNASKTREILSACAAAGVAVAFGSPIGGVLFSLEEMSSYFPLKTLWRSYFCALVATSVLAAMNPFRTGQLVMFQVHYDRTWHFFEIAFFAILGIFGGLYGAFVIKWNLKVAAFRKKYLKEYPIVEASLLAFITAILCFPNVFLRIEMTESMEILFLECEGGEDYHGLCEAKNRAWNIMSLLIALILRTGLVIISYGCKVPAGIFVPSMAIGALFGRTIGIVVQALQESFPSSSFFSSCAPDVPCITPGTYAFLGAAAALSGIMHITVSVVVIMFELTGALDYILPTMIVVGITKMVSDRLGHGGIADRMIWFNGFPYLDNKEEHNLGLPVSAAMTSDLDTIPIAGMTMESVERLLAKDNYQGFPIVEENNNAAESSNNARRGRNLVGFIGRTELRYAVDRARRERQISPSAKCNFMPTDVNAVTPITPAGNSRRASFLGDAYTVDFSRFVDSTPVTVHPRLPLETVMELFRKIGPRVILIEHRGRLLGLVTVKDCLKYQFKAEAAENGSSSRADDDDEVQEKIWAFLQRAAWWLGDKVSLASGGRISLNGSFDETSRVSRTGHRAGNSGNSRGSTGQILEGTEDEMGDEAGGVEMEYR
ncbi:hypothetical protein PoMZ_03794 [Pyricularia oryzae]|uniref:Chloride channel protein n=1 Tax=Pyricularia oryzae TaxID=318829 RepID=A0A4P7NC56_PYROR|nr:hypothetical protein PoMZ_03794 [Pyricularia oryzae]